MPAVEGQKRPGVRGIGPSVRQTATARQSKMATRTSDCTITSIVLSCVMAVIESVPAVMGASVQAYLHETLGAAPNVQAWPGAAKLPHFLQDAFAVLELTLLDRQILLAIDRQPNKPSLASIRRQMDALRHHAGVTVVYVTGALASYERKRLIGNKVAFIVPGNQLYLPELGVDLREYFRQSSTQPDAALSPATQAMLISVLLQQPSRVRWQPAEVVKILGYSAMTLSRAVNELATAGIATMQTEGRARWLTMERTAAETWEHAKPLLRSPTRRRFWAKPAPSWKPPKVRLAGLSALARYSMLADPEWLIYAISPAQWHTERQAGIEILPEHLPGACEWELWHYSPALVPNSDTVDPLSLTLCLQGNSDERIQLALDELKERFPW